MHDKGFHMSVKQWDNPDLRGKPVAVEGSRQRGVVPAADFRPQSRYHVPGLPSDFWSYAGNRMDGIAKNSLVLRIKRSIFY
jgi:hypothetical protein